jgi:hypothetical protein
MFIRFVRCIRNPLLLLGACVLAGMSAACGARPVARDFSPLSAATRIEVHTSGVRPLSIVTDPERIKVAFEFIYQYEKGWIWNGDRYLGDFGISPNVLTTTNYYREAPVEEMTRAGLRTASPVQ